MKIEIGVCSLSVDGVGSGQLNSSEPSSGGFKWCRGRLGHGIVVLEDGAPSSNVSVISLSSQPLSQRLRAHSLSSALILLFPIASRGKKAQNAKGCRTQFCSFDYARGGSG